MKYSENVFMDKFIQDVEKINENGIEGMLKHAVFKGMVQTIDTLISAS